MHQIDYLLSEHRRFGACSLRIGTAQKTSHLCLRRLSRGTYSSASFARSDAAIGTAQNTSHLCLRRLLRGTYRIALVPLKTRRICVCDAFCAVPMHADTCMRARKYRCSLVATVLCALRLTRVNPFDARSALYNWLVLMYIANPVRIR